MNHNLSEIIKRTYRVHNVYTQKNPLDLSNKEKVVSYTLIGQYFTDNHADIDVAETVLIDQITSAKTPELFEKIISRDKKADEAVIWKFLQSNWFLNPSNLPKTYKELETSNWKQEIGFTSLPNLSNNKLYSDDDRHNRIISYEILVNFLEHVPHTVSNEIKKINPDPEISHIAFYTLFQCISQAQEELALLQQAFATTFSVDPLSNNSVVEHRNRRDVPVSAPTKPSL